MTDGSGIAWRTFSAPGSKWHPAAIFTDAERREMRAENYLTAQRMAMTLPVDVGAAQYAPHFSMSFRRFSSKSVRR